jgi:hypothetical protein
MLVSCRSLHDLPHITSYLDSPLRTVRISETFGAPLAASPTFRLPTCARGTEDTLASLV